MQATRDFAMEAARLSARLEEKEQEVRLTGIGPEDPPASIQEDG